MNDDATTRPNPLRAACVAERVASTGIDEAMIERLVRAFYARVRRDPLIGPVFEAAIDDWEPHLRKLIDFWSSVGLMTARYGGKPMRVHAVMDIGPEHFARWLALFRETAAEVCTPAAAAFFTDKAEQIGRSLLLGIETVKGGQRSRKKGLGS